jgi:hypothetical protein
MPEVLPSSLVISPEGELVRTLVGPQTREQFEAALASAAAVQ